MQNSYLVNTYAQEQRRIDALPQYDGRLRVTCCHTGSELPGNNPSKPLGEPRGLDGLRPPCDYHGFSLADRFGAEVSPCFQS